MTTVTVDLIDMITAIADPTVATMTGIIVIIAATTAVMIVVMTDVMTTAAMIVARTTTTIGEMTVVMTDATTDVMLPSLGRPQPQRQQPQGMFSTTTTERMLLTPKFGKLRSVTCGSNSVRDPPERKGRMDG
jgi:hypothetical protein